MADSFDQQLDVLRRALDQAADAIGAVTEDQLSETTPCPDWAVSELISHLIQDAERFSQTVEGGEADWTIQPESVSGDWAGDFRSAADALVAAWEQKGEAEPPGPVWQASEIAIHTLGPGSRDRPGPRARRRRGRTGPRVHVECTDPGESRRLVRRRARRSSRCARLRPAGRVRRPRSGLGNKACATITAAIRAA